MKNFFKRAIKKIRSYLNLDILESYALDNLDIKILPYLNFKRGFFIEAGANDGVSQSNTLLFEKRLKWKGLLIEPIPELAEKCRNNRPNCIVENYALVPFEYNEKQIEMRYSNLMSLVKGAMGSEKEEIEHVKKGCELQDVKTYNIKVPVATLTSILEKHKISRIDLLSLDVEGYELSVLMGIDFRKFKPRFILVEARQREEIERYLHDLYSPIAQIGFYDVLFKLKN